MQNRWDPGGMTRCRRRQFEDGSFIIHAAKIRRAVERAARVGDQTGERISAAEIRERYGAARVASSTAVFELRRSGPGRCGAGSTAANDW
jgi:hypothetical protein